MESGHHCPYVGLKQNRAIRFATPTPEHRCYVSGDAQEIPVPQNAFCLSGNHVRCPLYTGEALPSIPAAPVAVPAPQSGVRGWLAGLSRRDRRIYGGLIGLLGLIIVAYIVGAVVYFSDDQPPVSGIHLRRLELRVVAVLPGDARDAGAPLGRADARPRTVAKADQVGGRHRDDHGGPLQEVEVIHGW